MHKLVSAVFIIVFLLATSCLAQTNQGMQGAGPGMGPGTAPGMGMMAYMVHGIAVDDTAIYVVRGNQILKLDKNNLTLINSAMLPPPPGQSAMVPSTGAGTGAGTSSEMGQPQSSMPSEEAQPGSGPSMAGIPSGAGPRPAAQELAQQICEMQPSAAEQAYLQAVMQSHNGAIAWSNLAKQKATRADLRRFAGRVADDESAINMRFGSWLRSWYGTRPVTSMSQADRQVLDTLNSLSGREFDIAYMRAMLTHFQEAVALSQNIASRAEHTELRRVALDMAQEHANQAQQLRTWLSQWYGITTG